MKLTDAQFGVLHQLREFGPINTYEVEGPPNMAGKRKVRLETSKLTSATLDALLAKKLVTVSRGEAFRPTDATGKPGHKRRPIYIDISLDGLTAI